MSPASLMGFQSWLEAGPPGTDWNRKPSRRRLQTALQLAPTRVQTGADSAQLVGWPFSKSRGTGWLAAKTPCGSMALRMPVELRPHVRAVRRAGVDRVLGEVEVLTTVRERRQGLGQADGVRVRLGAHLRGDRHAAGEREELRRPAGTGRRHPRGERPSAPPSWRSSATSSDDVASGPASARNASTAASGNEPSIALSEANGAPPSGSMCRRTSDLAGTRPKVSISGLQRAQAGEQLGAALVGAEDRAVDDDELTAAEERRAARAAEAAASRGTRW